MQLVEYSKDQVDLITRLVCKGGTKDEIDVFLHHCKRTGLDPFAKQIYAVKRWDSETKRETMAIQVSIDGFRLIAERTGEYDGQDGPYWCGADGKWLDVWTSQDLPFAAKVMVYRKGCSRPFAGIAYYRSCVGTKRDGSANHFWSVMPEHMLAKCAESMALRKAFPQELSGLYTAEELRNDEEPEIEVRPVVNGRALTEHSTTQPAEEDDLATTLQLEQIAELLSGLKMSLGNSKIIARVNEICGATITNGDQIRTLTPDQASTLIYALQTKLDETRAKEKQA